MSTFDFVSLLVLLLVLCGLTAGLVASRVRPALRAIPERPVILVRARAPLTGEELRRVLAGWEEKDPRRQALEDVMDIVFAELLADVSRRGVAASERDFAAGALNALRYLDAKLRDLARQPEARRGAEAPE